MATKLNPAEPGWQKHHVEVYLKTDGAEGHEVDFGGLGVLPIKCLLLQTTGRRSHAAQTTPLFYGNEGGSFVIIASHNGAPKHPAWFLNLENNPEVRFQIANKKYRGTARITAPAERERLYAMMAGLFPPYQALQAKTMRVIPVVVLEPQAEIERL